MAKIKLTKVQQKVVVGVLAGVIIIVGIVAVWLRPSPDGPTAAEKQVELQRSADDVQVSAAMYLNSGDIDGGLAYYDENIAASEDKEQKKSLLVFKSNYARMAERYDEAVAAAQQAEKSSSDISTIRALAQAYAAKGDREQALTQYKRLLKLRQEQEGEQDPNKLPEGREATLGSIIKELEQ